MKIQPKNLVATVFWCLTILAVCWSKPWGSGGEGIDGGQTAQHKKNFHMHRPLHSDGKVSMADQFHLELVSKSDGSHSLWVSNAFRQEMDPNGFEGTLDVEPVEGEPFKVTFQRVGRTNELRAKTEPMKGQAWLTVSGQLGQVAEFRAVKFFWDYELAGLGVGTPLGLDPMRPVPPGNPLTAERVELGRALFFDPQLSADGSVACASCHRPEHGYADNKRFSPGLGGRLGDRNTPTVLNAAYHRTFFWDGRASSLEQQALAPIMNHAEMGITDEETLVQRLHSKYEDSVQKAFGQSLSLETVAMALACYERSLLSGDSDFDRHEMGKTEALSQAAKRGRDLFFGKARCGNCHIPPLFTDYEFHNLGVGWKGSQQGDRGYFQVTGDEEDAGAFKTPSLRDVTRTAPYMHDGSLATLRDVVEYYNRGCGPNSSLDPLIEPLELSDSEIDDLLAMLETLEGRSPALQYAGAAPGPDGERLP